jgi:predicted nucleic acid-binding protein
VTRYLLDTDALVDFSKGFEPTTSQVLTWIDAGDALTACAITVGEFCSGLTPDELAEWVPFLDSLGYVDIDCESAVRAGQDRYRLSRAGKRLTIADSLIAAAARQHGAILVTGNVKDFPVEGVSLLSIR